MYNKNGKGKYMSTREKANKGKVLKYIQEQFENAKRNEIISNVT
jgi:cytoplasmic iron level regulating protein YaaA (DUF328/UPF0246 family)